MNTNQEKVKQLLGEENYQLLLHHGYIPVETSFLSKLLEHDKEIKKLQNKVTLLEKSMLLEESIRDRNPYSIH